MTSVYPGWPAAFAVRTIDVAVLTCAFSCALSCSPAQSASSTAEQALLHRLGEEVLAFYEWTKPTESERQLRAQVFACFETVVAEIWPNPKCVLFGSMQTGIYLPDGCVPCRSGGGKARV